jgi:hypothetical protein
MNKQNYLRTRMLSIGFLVTYLVFSVVIANSQVTQLAKCGTTVCSILGQYDNSTIHRICLGFTGSGPDIPSAIFHLKTPLTPLSQIFQVDATGIGSVMTWYNNGSTKFGIYQSSLAGQIVLNYFQDPLSFNNNMTVTTSSLQSNFSNSSTSSEFDFSYGATTPNFDNTPLRITPDGIIVNSKAIIDSGFQLIKGGGTGKVLISDNHGIIVGQMHPHWEKVIGC